MKKATLLMVIVVMLTTCRPQPPPETAEVTVPVTQPPPKPIYITVTATPPPSPTPTPYPSYTPYPTYTPPPTPTATPIPTDKSLPPADTPLPPTDTPVPPTDTPLPPTDTPLPPTDTPVPSATPSPPSPTPPVCLTLPQGGFLTIWQSDPDLQTALGCPTSLHPRITPEAWQVDTSYQPFARGEMIWSDHIGWYPQPVIYVLYADSTYRSFDDTFDPGVDPSSSGETPPYGLVEPILGFGKVWREVPGLRDTLGWATADETPGLGRFQMFTGGNMVWISQTNQTYVFIEGIVRVFDVPFDEE